MKKNSTAMEYQKAIDYIFQMIKEGRIIVGSKIPSERELAETLGIGRNSTREAISILRGMGLIESRHGSGNYIAKDSGRTFAYIVSAMLALGSISMKDILEFRRALAKSVVTLVFKNGFPDEEKEHLKKNVEKMESASGEELVMLDQEFHMTLIRATKNPLFIIVMEATVEVYHESVSKVIEESDEVTIKKLVLLHRKICDSIVEKDEEACFKYMNDHYNLSESNL